MNLQRLGNAARVLVTLAKNAGTLRAFLQSMSEARDAVLFHDETICDICRGLVKSNHRQGEKVGVVKGLNAEQMAIG